MSFLSEIFGKSFDRKVKDALNRFYRRFRALRDEAISMYLIAQKLPPEKLKQFWRENRADIRQLISELRVQADNLEAGLPKDDK